MTTIERDQEFIEIDHGGDRFTHHPSGDTLMRHQWLRESHHHAEWSERRRTFFDAHPDATWLVTLDRTRGGKASVIGDVRDLPWREGGGFSVGDVVVTTSGPDHGAESARRIVGTERAIDPSPEDFGHVFQLEDGGHLYWSPSWDAWVAMDPVQDRQTRVRKILPSEDYDTLRVEAHDVVAGTMPHAIEALTKLRQAGACEWDEATEAIERAGTAWAAMKTAVERYRTDHYNGFGPSPLDERIVIECCDCIEDAVQAIRASAPDGQVTGLHLSLVVGKADAVQEARNRIAPGAGPAP